MKVTLDLTKLLHEGKITKAEHDRLRTLAAEGTGSLAINILVGFGVIAVAGASVALVPTPATALAIGALVAVVGLVILLTRTQQWEVFGIIAMMAGALMFGGGVVVLGDGSIAAFALVAAIFLAAGIVARSGLMIAAAVLALSSCLGARTGYMHATYILGIKEPALTVGLFAVLALAAYQASLRLRAPYEGLALMAARTSLFLVNFGLWIGSLWGDRLNWLRGEAARDVVISREMFAAVWALALIGTGIWAVRANRRWVVTVVAAFGAIHFYTQWFERLGATPLSVLVAGLVTLAAAAGLWTLTRPSGTAHDRIAA